MDLNVSDQRIGQAPKQGEKIQLRCKYLAGV